MGLFITFEGIEGCGKSTQIGLLKAYLEGQGRKVLLIREPGSTPIGESIRDLLLTKKGDGMSQWTELFLYEACRAELVSEVIAPALENEVIIICDRFTDSTISYQGYGRGLDLDTLYTLNARASFEITPDLTVLLDCPVEQGLERANKRMEGESLAREDRFERESKEFHDRVRQGFLELAELEPARIKVVDASEAIDKVELKIRSLVDELLTRR